MSDGVFVVKEEGPGGLWIFGCCDRRCPDATASAHWSEHKTEALAKAAATRHRKLLSAIPDETRGPKRDECQNCGQSPTAIRDLQELVRELEARLALAGDQR